MARRFLIWEAGRRPFVAYSLVETKAHLAVTEWLAVSGRADRIDIRSDGRADIIDYKTGASPSAKVARTLLDPQLALEAAVLKGGGFEGVEPRDTQDLLYARLRPGNRFAEDKVNNEHGRGDGVRSAMELAEGAISQLVKLAGALRENKTGFKSRVAPFKDGDHGGEYDHLARVAEWSVAETEGGDADE
jgi:ATP-dependent helicase/nuclease subunit B